MMSGIHYAEIVIGSTYSTDLKIGVALGDSTNFGEAFSDTEFGYAYYGSGGSEHGCLRHNSNGGGPEYGKPFKNNVTIGIYLNMNKGNLGFFHNGEYQGIAYQAQSKLQEVIFSFFTVITRKLC